jgi:F-type H+-transporting ATPase subunit delta
MLNPRLATRYAKSLLDIAVERGDLESIKADVDFLSRITKSSRELRSMLRSPIVNSDKKLVAMNTICKDRIGVITSAFIRLLITKNRENVLPEILEAFYDQYNELKGIHKVKFITAKPISDELRDGLLRKFKIDAHIEHVELSTEVREDIIGGFILEYDNKLIDASIIRGLRDVKRQFYRNDYMYNIR